MADISNGMCEEEKNNMRALRNDQLGSCKKAVVTSDGVWHTWTFQQKRVIQYQKLFDRWIVVVWSQVYARQSTSKSMEGILAEECYKQAADEGCKVEVVWQDGDSRAAKAVGQHHHDGKVLRCGGHMGKVHRSCQKKRILHRFQKEI